MINPYGEFNDNAVLWENGNGDGVGDKNFGTTWDCSDPAAPPFVYGAALEVDRYAVFPADGLANTSFGLLAPDGKGIGYFAFADNTVNVNSLQVVDYGSPYDGIYYSGSTASGEETGWKYIASDSYRGQIGSIDRWDPHVWILAPVGGETLTPGLKYEIQWGSWYLDTVEIEYSTDGGVSWNMVASGVGASYNNYLWIVPRVNSSNCKIRISGTGVNYTAVTSDGLFTISGPSGVADYSDVAPRPFIAVANHPNPFNPSTTIRYELGMPGRVTLTVCNAIGQQVRKFDLGNKERGRHEILFNGSGLPSGVYLYRIDAGSAAAAGRMLLVR
jgi:hypothetical protein